MQKKIKCPWNSFTPSIFHNNMEYLSMVPSKLLIMTIYQRCENRILKPLPLIFLCDEEFSVFRKGRKKRFLKMSFWILTYWAKVLESNFLLSFLFYNKFCMNEYSLFIGSITSHKLISLNQQAIFLYKCSKRGDLLW